MAKTEPFLWAGLTATTVILEKYLLPDVLLRTDGFLRTIVDTLGNENIAKGVEVVINPLLGVGTLESAIRNWVPKWYSKRTIPKRIRRGLSAFILGAALTFPYQSAYVLEQAKNSIPRLRPCVGGKKLTLEQIASEHGSIHKKVIENLLRENKYRQLKGNPYLRYPYITLAIESVESLGDKCARGLEGEKGPMQLMPGTASDYAIKDPFNLEQGIEGGIRYFADLLLAYTSRNIRTDEAVKFAIAAYNDGQSDIDVAIARSPNRNYDVVKKRINTKTVWYVDKVLERYKRLISIKSAGINRSNEIKLEYEYPEIHPEFRIGHKPFYLTRNYANLRA